MTQPSQAQAQAPNGQEDAVGSHTSRVTVQPQHEPRAGHLQSITDAGSQTSLWPRHEAQLPFLDGSQSCETVYRWPGVEQVLFDITPTLPEPSPRQMLAESGILKLATADSMLTTAKNGEVQVSITPQPSHPSLQEGFQWMKERFLHPPMLQFPLVPPLGASCGDLH